MKLCKLCEQLDIILKKDIAYDWDNVGLLVGEQEAQITGITLTLELNDKVIDDAIDNNSQLIISHHPLIFSPLKTVKDDDLKQKMIIRLIKNNIALYTAHTNFDMVKGGLNDYVINLLDVKDVRPLEDTDDFDTLGRVATLKKPMTLTDFIGILQKKLEVKNIRMVSDKNKNIEKIAVVTGAGSEYIDIANIKSDLLITGDVKYHEAQDAYQESKCIVDAGHYDTEKYFGDAMKQFLECNLANRINTYVSNSLSCPFKFMEDYNE